MEERVNKYPVFHVFMFLVVKSKFQIITTYLFYKNILSKISLIKLFLSTVLNLHAIITFLTDLIALTLKQMRGKPTFTYDDFFPSYFALI